LRALCVFGAGLQSGALSGFPIRLKELSEKKTRAGYFTWILAQDNKWVRSIEQNHGCVSSYFVIANNTYKRTERNIPVSARARSRSCPDFKVGAAVECADGRTFSGRIIENSGYDSALLAPLAKPVFERALDVIRIAAPPIANCYMPLLIIHSFESI
jgi:hypothetical protein